MTAFDPIDDLKRIKPVSHRFLSYGKRINVIAVISLNDGILATAIP